MIGSTYGILYAVFRFTIEFFREPDAQLGYYFGWMTMGQILCLIMLFVAIIVLSYCIKRSHQVEFRVQ